MNEKLVEYIENVIIAEYANFDKAHGINHVRSVIERSLKYYNYLKDKNLKKEIIYVVAAYHDYGIKIERKGHAKHSKNLVLRDENLKQWFTEEEILIIADACEDHSTSTATPPRTIYGKIVSDADQDTDYKVGLMRSWEFAKHHNPNWTEEEYINDIHREIDKRFGKNGVVKFYINSQDNKRYIKKMRKLAKNKKFLRKELLSLI